MLKGKVTVGTIAYMGGVPSNLEAFTWAWGQLIAYNADYLVDQNERIHYDRATVSYHSFARNNLSDKMRGDWLLMLDMDHQFEPDLAARLLNMANWHGLDVLTGLYVYKQAPHNPVLFTRRGDKVEYLGDWDKSAQVFEVGAAGAGCLFVRRSVFARIRAELDENPFEIRKCFSEDNSFFDRCHELGIKTWCCPMIESPHLAVRPFTLADYTPDTTLLGARFEVEGRI